MEFSLEQLAEAYDQMNTLIERFHGIYCETVRDEVVKANVCKYKPYELFGVWIFKDIEGFEFDREFVTVKTYDDYRDRKANSYYFPKECLNYTDQQIQEFAKKRVAECLAPTLKQLKREKEEQAKAQEDKDRLDFERLKAKFENSEH